MEALVVAITKKVQVKEETKLRTKYLKNYKPRIE